MAADLVLLGSPDRLRRHAAGLAAAQLVQESCFLSPERARHGACRQQALALLGLDDAGDDQFLAAIQADPAFAQAFHCQGAAAVCAACGGLAGPGALACPECGQALAQPVGVLARPEWERRLVTRGLEIAITTTLVADSFLMHSIQRTVRLLVLRNLLGQSPLDDWRVRVREVRATVLDAWPEARRPGSDTWEYRFIRACAVFWVLAWPMLAEGFTLEEVDGWSSKLVRAAAVSSQRWAEAGADPATYGRLVRGIMDAEGLQREQALLALAPNDLAGEGTVPAGAVVLHPPELVYERSVRALDSAGTPWLLIELAPEEDQVLAHKGIRLADPGDVAQRFSGGTAPAAGHPSRPEPGSGA